MKMTASRRPAPRRPSMIAWPCGVCTSYSRRRIQNVETSVPTATMTVDMK